MKLIEAIWQCCSGEANKVPLHIVKGNDVCRVYDGRRAICVAFDGSNDAKDWISNFRAGKDGITHKGFYNSFMYFAEDLEGYISHIAKSCENVIFTGHSRGGALATLAAEYFVHNGILKSCSCVTFGAPKVGNKEYRDRYNKLPIDHTGYRNGWDIVTYLPPAVMRYRHVGKVVRLKRPWYRKLLLSFRIKDHLKPAYNKALKKYVFK